MIRYEPDDEWAVRAADSSVTELLMAKLIDEEGAQFAREIIAQQLHVRLSLLGVRPQENSN